MFSGVGGLKTRNSRKNLQLAIGPQLSWSTLNGQDHCQKKIVI